MTLLDSLSLSVMAGILAVLLHVSGTVSLSPAPLMHAVTPEPSALQSPEDDAPPATADPFARSADTDADADHVK